jgi:hypothetical protein
MHCTNCGSEVSDTAKVCGYCGHRLKDNPIVIPERSLQPVAVAPRGEIPGLVWGLIGGLVALVGVILFAIFFLLKPETPAAPAPVINSPVPIVRSTEKINTPVVHPSATPTRKPPTITPTKANQRCDLFKGMKFSIIWIDIPKGSTVAQLYAKMPGGVPGLEKIISGDNKSWDYEFKIGDYNSTGCSVIEGYKERLYCEYLMPSGYPASIRPMELYVNGCDKPIYKDPNAELPGIQSARPKGGGSSGTGCSSGLDAAACSAAGGTFTTMQGFCDPGPCPSSCSCP